MQYACARKLTAEAIKEDVMKSTIKNALLAFMGSISTAFAANGAEKTEPSLLLYLFLGFGALIIVFQAIPGIMLFFPC